MSINDRSDLIQKFMSVLQLLLEPSAMFCKVLIFMLEITDALPKPFDLFHKFMSFPVQIFQIVLQF